MLAVTNHLLIIHVPQHSFQEDLLHDLGRHRGETDWTENLQILDLILLPKIFFLSGFSFKFKINLT